MYHENIDEQLISKVSDHHSNAVCRYKKNSDSLRRQISSVIQGHSTMKSSTNAKPKVEGSDLSDFEVSDKVIVTPGKCKVLTTSTSNHTGGISDFIKSATNEKSTRKLE